MVKERNESRFGVSLPAEVRHHASTLSKRDQLVGGDTLVYLMMSGPQIMPSFFSICSNVIPFVSGKTNRTTKN